MQKIFAANWKMYKTRAEAAQSAADLAAGLGVMPEGQSVMVFAPFTVIGDVAAAFNGVPGLFVGGQNCYPAAEGAFTGEISPAMVRLFCWPDGLRLPVWPACSLVPRPRTGQEPGLRAGSVFGRAV